MNKKCFLGFVLGFLLLLFAMPLGELYGNAYITIGSGMLNEQYVMLMERAIVSFQIIGGVVLSLSGLALILSFREDK